MSYNVSEHLRFAIDKETTFTTEPKTYFKRGFGTVRNKCMQFIALLIKNGYTHEIPLTQAIDLFQLHMPNAMDQKTLKAYFGTMPSKSKKIIYRTARYQTGTISNKTIELTENIPKRVGYFEKLGLVHYEKRKETWFFVFTYEYPLVPEIAHSNQECETVEQKPIDNFSLPLKPLAINHSTPNNQHELNMEIEKRESVIEGERNRLSESNRFESFNPNLYGAKPLGKAILKSRIQEEGS